jgi:hypothetical protein
MHISEKSWSGQKCIIQRNVDLDNPGSKRLLQPAKKYTNICIFPWKNAYVWKILEPSKVHIENVCCPKMHIENAYFVRDIFTAIQKCVMDSGRPTFLICTVCPKAVLW